MFFDGNDFDFEMPMISENTNDSSILVNSDEGFMRGNMFKDLYVPYKDMTYIPFKASNEKEELMYKIMEMDFVINDLNLYLDLNPEDKDIYEKFKMYVDKCIALKDEYSKKYGPLTIDQVDSNGYKWEEEPWPWDGGNMYV